MQYARAGDRLLAAILDIVAVWGSVFVVLIAVSLLGETAGAGVLAVIAFIGIPFYVYVVMTAKTGQTIGKRVLKIKVVDAQGNVPSIGTAFLREILGKFISGVLLYIGFLWIIFDGRVQGWHDKIADTFVVKVQP